MNFAVCNDPKILELVLMTKTAISLLQIIAPLGVVVFASIDIMKAVMAKDQDGINKQIKHIPKRLIAMAILFFVPTFVDLSMKVIDSSFDYTTCFTQASNENIESLYQRDENGGQVDISQNYIGRTKKDMPTIGSWYRRICRKAQENENPDYRFHYSYLVKVMKQYVREYQGQMAYFDGQSTFELLDGVPFINLDISQLEERFARPLAQQVMLSWIWEKYVKKNSEDKTKAAKKRVLVDEAWMLLPYPEAVDFLNTMARRARKRNVSLAVVSQKFQDFYEKKEAQAILTSSEIKLFLAQDKSEIASLTVVLIFFGAGGIILLDFEPIIIALSRCCGTPKFAAFNTS